MNRINAVARRQHGVVSWQQMLATGATPAEVRTMLRRDVIRRVLPSVYVIAGSPGTREQALAASQLWAGDPSALTGLTAIEVWEVGARATAIEVLVPRSNRRRREGIEVHRTHEWDDAHVTRHRGLVVVRPARALFDAARSVDEETLESILEEFLRRRLIRLGEVEAVVARWGVHGRAGSAAMRAVLERRDPALAPSNQMLEVKAWRLLRDSGLPLPFRNLRVVAAGQRFELDFAWPEQRVALETDGFGPHSGRRAFEADRQRMSALVASGWRVVQATWRDVTNPALATRLIERLAATLALAP